MPQGALESPRRRRPSGAGGDVRGEAGAAEETRADPKRVSEEEVAAIGVARPPLRGTLTVIDGQVYDIAPFLDKHPGGADLILLAAGRDATVMFHSYHRDLAKVRQYLKPLRTEQALTPATPVQPGLLAERDASGRESVYAEIKRRANVYFSATKQASRGGLVGKSLLLLGALGLAWWLAVVENVWAVAPLVGVLMAVVGLSIQHDANHGAFSESPALNAAFGFCDDLIGGSALCWRHQHMVAHHADPNIVPLDADTYLTYPVVRMNPGLPLRWFHAWQHLYVWALYSLMGVSYALGDFFVVLSGSYAHVQLHELRAADWLQFLAGKALHFALFWAAPVLLHGWGALLTTVLPLQLVGGLFLAACFAVSHNSEGALYNPDPAATEWAELQIRTGVNWSVLGDPDTPDWWAWFWLYCAGGLNYQIEHHLFPGVAHVHYPALSRIVRAVCAERNIPYNAYGSWWSILASHFRVMRALGAGRDHQVYTASPRSLPAPRDVEPKDLWDVHRIPGEVDE